MEDNRWSTIKSLFRKALAVPAEERPAFLERAAGGDTAIVDEVLRLLDSDGVDSELSGIVQDAAEHAISTNAAGLPDSIGLYRIVKRLGQGGMGAVYLAERSDDQFEQRVAIKVVLVHNATSETIERFRWERQILANLSHPNIAHLHDGGETVEGLPYFVMEYVEGIAIDSYCDEHRLGLKDRLKLFCDICEAVQHAHKNLVIHRDIKPQNILVTDGGVVKLLDFGVAKLLNDQERLQLTQIHGRVMTPEYASPEQVRGDSITTLTDVYSLGVLLFRLLSGRSPYEITSGVHDLERAILAADPLKLSTRAGSATESPQSQDDICRARGLREDQLARALRGDLDNIVRKALRKRPENRYSSVRAMADDIHRYLNDEPVTAHPPTLRYRAGKFVRRNRLAVFATAATVATVALLIGFYTLELTRERDKATQVADFALSLFENADPRQSLGATVTARQLLDEGAARIDGELASQPLVQAEMQDVMGTAYYNLGLYEESQVLLDSAAVTRRDLLTERHVDTLETITNLGNLALMRADHSGAESIFENATDISRQLHGNEHADTAALISKLGRALHEQGHFEAAETYYQEALSIQNKLFPGNHESKAATLLDYGRMLTNAGRYALAEELLRESVAMSSDVLGPQHPDVAAAMNQLAFVLMDTAQWVEAEKTIRDGITITRKIYGDEHPDVVNDMGMLASVLGRQGRFVEAEAKHREVLELDLKTLGPEHPYVAIDQNNLAGALLRLGRYDEAESLYREAIALHELKSGPEHPETATTISNLASLLTLMGKLDEAKPYYERALATRRKVLGDDNPNTLFTQHFYINQLRLADQLEEARRVAEDTLERRRRVLGDAHPDVAATTMHLAAVLRDLGELQMAETLATSALGTFANEFDPPQPDLAYAQWVLGSIQAGLGDFDSARSSWEDALAQQRAVYPDGHPETARTLASLGESLLQAHPERAPAYLEAASALYGRLLSDEHPAAQRVRRLLDDATTANGDKPR